MKLSERIDTVVERLQGRGVDLRPIEYPEWILDIERRIGCALPETYRNLLVRYSFPQFEIGPVILFSNLGDGSEDDITTAPFRDTYIFLWVNEARYFHFARASSGSYDPMCLDLTAATYPKQTTRVVKFNHEAIICELPPVSFTVISESFLDLLEEHA